MHLEISGDQALLICGSGDLFAGGDRQAKLSRFDTAVLDGSGPLRIEGKARFFLIEFYRLV